MHRRVELVDPSKMSADSLHQGSDAGFKKGA